MRVCVGLCRWVLFPRHFHDIRGCIRLYPTALVGVATHSKTPPDLAFNLVKTGLEVVPPRGVEPPTFGTGNRRSIH